MSEQVSVPKAYMEALEAFADAHNVITSTADGHDFVLPDQGVGGAREAAMLRRVHALRPKQPTAIDVLRRLTRALIVTGNEYVQVSITDDAPAAYADALGVLSAHDAP